MSDIPKTHLRYLSLTLRDTIVEGVAHGRGEAMEMPTLHGYNNAAVLQKALQHISRSGDG